MPENHGVEGASADAADDEFLGQVYAHLHARARTLVHGGPLGTLCADPGYTVARFEAPEVRAVHRLTGVVALSTFTIIL